MPPAQQPQSNNNSKTPRAETHPPVVVRAAAPPQQAAPQAQKLKQKLPPFFQAFAPELSEKLNVLYELEGFVVKDTHRAGVKCSSCYAVRVLLSSVRVARSDETPLRITRMVMWSCMCCTSV